MTKRKNSADLLTKRKQTISTNLLLNEQWHPTRNIGFSKYIITLGSDLDAWWRHYDKKNKVWHEWHAVVGDRCRKHQGCAVCAGRQVQVGVNDLLTKHPILCKEWNYEKNKELTPLQFTSGSSVGVWWRHYDRKNKVWHEWYATIKNRSIHSRGCAICYGKQVQIGVNDLITTRLDLASEWNYEKNGLLTPYMVTRSTNLKVWWKHFDLKTNMEHEWIATINSRDAGNNCGICSGQVLVVGINDLATINPTLAQEWDTELNYPLTPSMVTKGTSKKVWWKHFNNLTKTWHSWRATVASRSAGSNCGKCYGSGGFKSNKPGYLYLVEGEIESHKVTQFGISQDLKNRLRTHRLSGFDKVLATIDFPVGSEAMVLERKLINLMKEHHLDSCRAKGILFDGASEAFCLEDVDQDFLDEFMELITL